MAFSTTDTIVAIATPPGRGGIGVVRLSGPEAQPIAQALITHRDPLQPRHATLSKVRLKADTTESGDAIDHVVATLFPAPHSYTGENVVELSAHGSPVVLRAIVTAALTQGARLAEPGEFTLRAFLNGRIDLAQAEAVNDLIEAVTPLQARAAFDQLDGTLTRAIAGIDAALFDLIARLEASVDFPEEGYHFVAPGALAEAIDGLLSRTDGVAARRAARTTDSRRPAGGDRRRAERREVEFVQRAGRRLAGDRHRRAGHDARPGDRDDRHRGAEGHARRHGGSSRHGRCRSSARASRAPSRRWQLPTWCCGSRINRCLDRAGTN